MLSCVAISWRDLRDIVEACSIKPPSISTGPSVRPWKKDSTARVKIARTRSSSSPSRSASSRTAVASSRLFAIVCEESTGPG